MSIWIINKNVHALLPPEHCVGIDYVEPGKTRHTSFAKVVVRMQGDSENDPALMARAHLIAAAPDMADLLELMLRSYVLPPAFAKMARDLLDKARGT